MQVHELAEKSGKTSKALCAEFGLKSHLSKVPQDIVDLVLSADDETGTNDIMAQIEAAEKKSVEIEKQQAQEVKEVKEEILPLPKNENIVKKETKQSSIDLVAYEKAKELSIRCLGNKSPYWGK